jgi:hypothetical protein
VSNQGLDFTGLETLKAYSVEDIDRMLKACEDEDVKIEDE